MNELQGGPEDENVNKTEAVYKLRLFITGASPNSVRAITNTKNICELYLSSRYELEIIDIYQQPDIAEQEQLIAVPLLVRKYPFPERRMIGDMSDLQKVLNGLEIKFYK
jgi:circadian clock protein KaiB